MFMKKTLLLSLTLIAATGLANAKVGGTQTWGTGYALTNVWSCDANVSLDKGEVRSGAGANDKFFVVHKASKTVYVYDANGKVKDITFPTDQFKTMWPTASADDAGNILVRIDKIKDFPYTTNGDPGFMVIESKTAEVVKNFVPMTQQAGYRADALGHVQGDILTGEAEHIYVTVANNGNFKNVQGFNYDKCEFKSNTVFPIVINTTYFPNAAAIATTGVAQGYKDGVAVFANYTLNQTGSNYGLGNCIQRYSIAEGETTYTPNGYFITPQHSNMPGFTVFSVGGAEYIIYPSGQSGATMAADAFAISKVKYVETPVTTDTMTDEEKDALVARVYAATDAAQNILYAANNTCTPVYNIEPVDGETNSVYIYAFCSGAPMNKWKFTVPDQTQSGIGNIEAADEDAPVEYFNMQGMRVENPEHGVYIKRQGSKAAKVVL